VAVPRAAIDHSPGRAQRWSDVDRDVGEWVTDVAAGIGDVLGSRLVAIYLHGSLAMGSYYRPKSDLDLLVVADGAFEDGDRRELAVHILETFDRRPTIGGLELSIVQHRDVRDFHHPLPYDFHFSERWASEIRQGGAGPHGRDPDLAAHCTVTRSRGIALRGEPAAAVVGLVPHEAFVASIVEDLQWIVGDGGIHESPFYGVLNTCRVHHVFAEGPGHVVSKEEGALWALDHLPDEHHTIITHALECYRSRAEVTVEERPTHGHDWDHDALDTFCAYTATAGLLDSRS
jgi:predicted nucleotidyltransferase